MDKTQFISGVFDMYDERLLESRLTEEGNVCGSLLKDLTLYDDCGLTHKDFITKSGRLLFRIGQEIRKKKYNEFDEITFLSATNDDLKERINDEFGGYRMIQNVIDAVSLKNGLSIGSDKATVESVLGTEYTDNFGVLTFTFEGATVAIVLDEDECVSGLVISAK